MGRKKKFIDKKRSATYQLLSRDTSALSSTDATADRVFVRVDNNPCSVPGLTDADLIDDSPNSIFADAPGDSTDDDDGISASAAAPRKPTLPDNLRKEILELGLPDDGYNYLLHLRQIGGTAYYHNSKAQLDRVQHDVKAFDASRLRVRDDETRDLVCAVASETVSVDVRRVADPDVMRLLDDGDDLSRFGSDVEDLEEDFVVKANDGGDDGLEEEEEEEEEVEDEEGEGRRGEVGRGRGGCSKEQEDEEELELAEKQRVHRMLDDQFNQEEEEVEDEEGEGGRGEVGRGRGGCSKEQEDEEELELAEKQRVHRMLDDQFNQLMLQEYDTDSDGDDACYIDIERESHAAKITDALKEYTVDHSELEDKYRAPVDEQLGISADVIRKCIEYAERYCDDNTNDEEMILEESSDESDGFDCETIISTYSNLDNHPGKIQAPENPKLRFLKRIPEDCKNNMITLGGKEKLPVEFLPHNRKSVEKLKTKEISCADKHKTKPHGGESKEEKKERKAAVKEERREARKAKKELKGLYRCETQRAQKAVAISGPSSIHIM